MDVIETKTVVVAAALNHSVSGFTARFKTLNYIYNVILSDNRPGC